MISLKVENDGKTSTTIKGDPNSILTQTSLAVYSVLFKLAEELHISEEFIKDEFIKGLNKVFSEVLEQYKNKGE